MNVVFQYVIQKRCVNVCVERMGRWAENTVSKNYFIIQNAVYVYDMSTPIYWK